MGSPVIFAGVNKELQPPAGNEHNVSTLPIFNNGVVSISCWELSDVELEEIVRTKRVFLSIMFGSTQPPCYVGSESSVRDVNADFGLYKRS